MGDETNHAAFVNAWLAASGRGRAGEAMVQLVADGFAAMWARAHATLGEVTLGAILERVLLDATAQHPMLASLEIEATGLRFVGLREQPDHAPAAIVAAIRTVLVDFLTVLGNLTGEILTPALHAAILAVGPGADGENAS